MQNLSKTVHDEALYMVYFFVENKIDIEKRMWGPVISNLKVLVKS